MQPSAPMPRVLTAMARHTGHTPHGMDVSGVDSIGTIAGKLKRSCGMPGRRSTLQIQRWMTFSAFLCRSCFLSKQPL